MCGIAGVANSSGLPPESRHLLQKMCDAMSHRGPDDEGFHFTQNAGIAMRRLSIIDLSGGHQPIFNEDRSLSIVLNGEIYNYRELRRELEAKGHHFSTASDTETILHMYEEMGEACITRLRGMFCIALWDEKRQRLLLARDRVGIKQLYYTLQNGELHFASEIKCLLQDPSFSRRVNSSAIASYLTFLYVPAPATMFEGVSELPAAHTLVWEQGKVRVQRYWNLEYNVDAGHPESFYVEGLRAKLADAVESHLVSDVPLGAFLSGGIDSGTVVALMAESSSGPVVTFTVGLESKYGNFDERADARAVANQYHTQHHDFLVQPDVRTVLPKIVWALDQPQADSSSIPNYYVCQTARTLVTVALSGMGGDEIAGGYERYLGILLGEQYRSLPAPLRAALARGAKALPDFGGTGRFSAARLKRFLASAGRDPAAAYCHLLSTFHPHELADLLTGDLRAELQQFHPVALVEGLFRASGSPSRVNQMLYADLHGYLPGDLLALTDRMSMVHSLEVRVPLLDHELLEYVATIPPELKIRGMSKKHILREAASKWLTREHMEKPKRGFSIPLAFWLRNELRSFVEEQLSPSRLRQMGYFEPAKVAAILEQHFTGKENHENKIWALLIFALWHDLYMEGVSVEDLAGASLVRA